MDQVREAMSETRVAKAPAAPVAPRPATERHSVARVQVHGEPVPREVQLPDWINDRDALQFEVAQRIGADTDQVIVLDRVLVERPASPASEQIALTLVSLRHARLGVMWQEFSGHLSDRAEVRRHLSERLGEDASAWEPLEIRYLKRDAD
jgi:hypothetical protein